MSRPLLVLLLAVFVTACGQKGPLYMPAKPPAAGAVAPAAPAADEKKDEEKKDAAAAPASSAPVTSPAPAAH
jgi:predicted small lipoprotein YifL